MKKSLFFLASAALVLASCENDQLLDKNTGLTDANQPKEIALSPLSQTPKRSIKRAQYAVTTTTFPTDNSMEVAAYMTVPETGNYFAKTTFNKGAGDTWKGNKFWPLGVSKLNFFAVSGYGLTASHITIQNNLSGATVAYTTANSYSATTQSDIMYAFGRGAVTKPSNALVFNNVDMQFKHALALVDFEVKANSQTEIDSIKVKSIALKGATYNGTLTLTNTNAATESDAVTTAVSWAAGDVVTTQDVPGIATPATLTNAYARIGNGLMVIPGTGFTKFEITYTMGGHDYTYEYTPDPAISSTTENNKYTYRILFKMHEIEIAPTVAEWSNTNYDVTIQN